MEITVKITRRQLRRIIKEAADMQSQPGKAIRAAKAQIDLLENDLDELAKAQIDLLENDLDELARTMAEESDMEELEIQWHMYQTALSKFKKLTYELDKLYRKEISDPRLKRASEEGRKRKEQERADVLKIRPEEIEMVGSDIDNLDDHFWG